MTSSTKINNLLKHKKSFIGCFSHDFLPDLTLLNAPFPIYLIINTCKNNVSLVGHWTVLFLKDSNECFYFNSFGGRVKSQNIKQFLSQHYTHVWFNNIQIQSRKSQKCAYFCIKFIKSVKCKIDYIRFLKYFKHIHLKQNDILVHHV